MSLLFVPAEVVALVAVASWAEVLPRNPIVGIRTRSTMRSADGWRRGHRAAAPWTMALAAYFAAAGLLLGDRDMTLLVVLAVSIPALGLAIWTANVAGREADKI